MSTVAEGAAACVAAPAAAIGGAGVALMRSASLGVDIAAAKSLATSSKALLATLQPALAYNEEDAFDAAKLLLSVPSDTIAHAAVVGGHKLDARMSTDPLAGPMSLLIHAVAVAAAGDEGFSVHDEAPPHVTGLGVVLLLLEHASKLIRGAIFGKATAAAAAGGAGAVDEAEVEAMLAKVRERGIRVAALASNLFTLADLDGAVAAAEAAQDAVGGAFGASEAPLARRNLEKASVRLARSAANVALAARLSMFAAEIGAAAGSGTDVLEELPAMVPALVSCATRTSVRATDAVVGALAFVLDALAEPWAEIAESFEEDAMLGAKAASLRTAATREGVSESTVDYASYVAEKLTAVHARLAAQAARAVEQAEEESRAELANELYADLLAERRADIEAAREAKAHRRAAAAAGAAELAEDPDELDVWVSKNHKLLMAQADLPDEKEAMSGPWFSGKRGDKARSKAADTSRAVARAEKARGRDGGDM